MALFGKKEEEKTCDCQCQGSCHKDKADQHLDDAEHTFKILGSGCKKCNTLEENVIRACESMGKQVNIEHVTDFSQIAAYGVMSTPGLVLDEDFVSTGKVLSEEDIKAIIIENC
ncbi:thioredoxin family protein [Streptococcus uberis]|nr:thioredoxin family protein [Streptococcus uberis]MCK1255419.1 thioredoxin family protein [Streptococcus uberis]